MHLSMHNWMRPEPVEVTLERLARCGYGSIEISGEPTQYDVDATRGHLDRLGLRCWGSVTLMTDGRDLIHEDPYVRRGTVAYMTDCVRMTAALGGEVFCIVPATVGKVVPSAAPDVEWEWAVKGLREVAVEARDAGVRIGIEPLNRFETYFINRQDQALLLAEHVGNDCGVVLDAFHLNIEEADPVAAIHATGDRLIDFHVADNNRFPPGQGALDWPALIGALRAIGYDGALTAEFAMPIDRTPVTGTDGATAEADGTEVTPGMDKFVRDHGSGVISERRYDELVEQTASYLRGLL